MSSFDLHLVNSTVPTHFTQTSSTLLDIFLVNSYDRVLFYNQLNAPTFSHHDLIFLTFDFETIYRPNNRLSFKRDFKNINKTSLELDIRSIPWENIYLLSSPNDQVEFLNTNILYLYNTHVPLKQIKTRNVSKPWFTNIIKDLINQRDQAYRRWVRTRVIEFQEVYKALRNRVVLEIRTAKKHHFASHLQTKTDGKKLWKNLRELGLGKNLNLNLILTVMN